MAAGASAADPRAPLPTAEVLPWLPGLLTVWLGVGLFLLPLKLGLMLSQSHATAFPLGWSGWILSPWPNSLAPVFGGAALLLAVLAHVPPARGWWWQSRELWLPIALLPLVVLPSLAYTTELDLTWKFLFHLLGAVTLTLAALLHLHRRPQARNVLLVAWFVGVIGAAASGWEQHFLGFAEQLDYMAYQAAYAAEPIDLHLRKILIEGRVYGPFANPNVFGGYLVLALPLALACIWRWMGKVEPPGPSRAIFCTLGALFLFSILMLTQSRAAQLSLFVALFLTLIVVVTEPRVWRAHRGKIILVTLGLLVIGGLSLSVMHRLRPEFGGTATIHARLVYLRSSVLMTRDHPLLGVGMGEWYPWHLRVKDVPTDETRYPHDVLFLFQAQCGVLGGLAALYLLLLPLWLWWHVHRGRLRPCSPDLWLGAWCGVTAWLVHSLMEFSFYAPAVIMTGFLLPVLVCQPPDEAPAPTRPSRGLRLALAALALLALGGLVRLTDEVAFERFVQRLGREPAATLETEAARLSAQQSASPYLWFMLGTAARRQLESQLSGAAASLLLEAQQRSPPPLVAAAIAHTLDALAMGETAGAATVLVQAAPLPPDLAAVQRSLQALGRQELRGSVTALTAALAQAPDTSTAVAARIGAVAEAADRTFALTERAFRQTIARAPHRSAYQAYLAQSLAAQERWEEARTAAELAVTWYPTRVEYVELRDAIVRRLATPATPAAAPEPW